MSSKILVTGGAGYVGSVCSAELLRMGHRVTIVDNLSTGSIDAIVPGATFYKADIGDRVAIAKLLRSNRFDCVFHFAAKAVVPESVRDPGSFFLNNVVAGVTFIEDLRAAGVTQFVFSSTAAVYGTPKEIPISEDYSKDPLNSYGEGKLAFERILRWYVSAYHWSVVVFRYFNACGATSLTRERHDPETHIIPLLLQTASGRRPYFSIFGDDYATADGTCVRDYVHVLDIANAHILAMQKLNRPGIHTFNIGNQTGYSVLEVIKTVEEVTGCQIPSVVAPRREGDPPVLIASCEKLRSDLGWVACNSDLRQIVSSAWEMEQCATQPAANSQVGILNNNRAM